MNSKEKMIDNNFIDFIEESPLIFKIKNVSLKILKEWYNNAKKPYNAMNNIWDIVDSADVINDVVSAFSLGIKCYLEKIIPKQMPYTLMNKYHNIGYFCGVVQGRLNSIWNEKYAINFLGGFKEVALFQAIKDLIGADELLGLKVEILYLHYLKINNVPIHKPEIGNVIHLSNHDSNCQSEEFRAFSNDALADITNKKYSELLLELQEIMFCPDITDYFEDAEIQDLLDQSKINL